MNVKILKEKFLRNYSTWDRKKFPFVYLLILFPVLQMIVFWFCVNVSSVMMAFQDAEGNWSFNSLQRVFQVFQSETDQFGLNVPQMLGRSVFIWIMNHAVMFCISIVCTFWLAKHMIWSKFFRITYMIPGLVGSVLFTSIMKNLYAYDGAVTQLLLEWNVDLPILAFRNGLLGSEETAFPTLMIQMFIYGIAGGSLILTGAYLRIPEEIFESAKLEGCGLFRETFQIAIPCVKPTLTTMMIFSLCSIFTADYNFYLYSNGTGARGMNSIGFYLYILQLKIARGESTDYSYVSAFGLVISFITIPFVLLGRKILTAIGEDVTF